TSTNLISQLNILIVDLEASGDYEEVFDLVMELQDDRRDEQDKMADFNRIMETQANDDQDPLVNYDNDNENDNLGYLSEEYFDEVQEDDENNNSNENVVKRGITRLYKFCKEYGKSDGIKLSVTFDALFLSFLGDMVRKHIVLKILSWKKRYFDVDLTIRKLVKSATAKMACSKSVYQYTIGRGSYALVKEKMRSGDRHQPTSQQSSHRSHGHNNDGHGSDRRGSSDNHRRSNNNNYSGSNNRNSGNGRDQRNRGHQSNRSANSGSQQSRGPSEGYSYLVCTTCGRRHQGECRRAA
nr:hypothetical protein [Tanacetum cinerariifolium]